MMIAELGYKFLAILITLGVLVGTGYTTYPAIGYIMLAFYIYIYCSAPTTEDMLFRILLITTIYFVLSYVFEKHKEGFYITPTRLISRNMTAKQCQDYCGRNKHCKYANVPKGTSLSGKRGRCYNSYGQGQRHFGSKNRYYDTWQNKNYVQPPPPKAPRLFKHGEFIAIKSAHNNQWLAADPRGSHDQIGRRRHRITWETFQVLHHPNGNPKHYLIKSYHGKWLICNTGWKWRGYPRMYFHNFGRRKPTKGWTWEKIEFKQKSNGRWGIYNPHHRRYLNTYYNHLGLGVGHHSRHEEFYLYRVPSTWGRHTREWNDKPVSGGKNKLPLKVRYGRTRAYWNPPFRHRGNRGGTIWKLGRCEGDCDSNNQCMPGLKCKQRNGYEKVPGCTGRGIRGWDYCYDPSMS